MAATLHDVARVAARADRPALQVVRLEPSRGWARLRLDQVWTYRELVFFLAQRDVKVRYAQTALGAAWAVLQPLLASVVFAVVFGRLARIPTGDTPYVAFALAGMVPWTYFSTYLQATSMSLVGNVNLVAKVWFPRLCLPIAAALAGVVDLAVSSVVLLVVVLALGVGPTWAVLLTPLLVVYAVVSVLGIGLVLAAVNVRYRDVRQAVPFLVQVWLFVTPVVYPADLVEGWARAVYGLNPVLGVVELFRWAFAGIDPRPGDLALSIGSALALLLFGALWFRRAERTFADVI